MQARACLCLFVADQLLIAPILLSNVSVLMTTDMVILYALKHFVLPHYTLKHSKENSRYDIL